jgi:hypothetical protein
VRPGRRQRGLSKLEFAVVLAIFGVLAHLLLGRLTVLEHETERLEVTLTLRHIDIGLKLAIGERLMRGQDSEIPALLDRNPLEFLEAQKVGAGDTAGSWGYDGTGRILRYRPRQPEAFGGETALRWRFAGQRDELGRTVGLGLEPIK